MAKDDKTFENLPNSAVEYINLVIKNMRYRKKAHDEVREELIDHFEVYLKDCATNEEKEQKAQQLISEFGDPKLLAILMRRAKKRCRPLWRTVVARTFQALAAMIILLILYIAWFFTGEPVITTNYIAELNKIVRPSADDSANAFPLCNKAIKTLVDVNDVKELLHTHFYDANDEQKNIIRQWLAKNEESLALVTKASKLPYCWQRYESKDPEQSMMTVILPDLVPIRDIAYALCWRAWLNAQSNDFNSAFQDIETCYRLGRHYRGEKILVEQLVGMAIKGRTLQTVRQMLDTFKIDSIALAGFQQRLQNLIDGDNFKPDISLEKLITYDEIQRSFTDSRFGPSHLYPKRIMEISGLRNANPKHEPMVDLILTLELSHDILFSPNKTETIANINAFYELFNEKSSKTPARLKAEGINIDFQTSQIVNNNVFLRILMPALARVNIIGFRNKIDAESTTLIIALVRYKQDTGAFPESLDKLVEKGYIKQVPVDPFSDKPIAYRKTDNNFLLYSWGENLKDDDGQVARSKKDKPLMFADTGDWVFWPVVDGRYDQKK
jgi:dsDNA-binding SOS-regulon protein